MEDSAVGRIVVAPELPRGFALFYTTIDFDGRLDDAAARRLTDVTRERFGIDATLTTCNQVHGADARRAPRETSWRECDSCDALFADAPGTALGIKVADCLPVTLIDPEHRVIANIHSGWRGAAQQIVAKTLDALAHDTEFDAQHAMAWLGPSIRVCCFEVGEEVVDALATTRWVDRTRAKPHVDLVGYTTDVLHSRGVTAIHDSALCTRCDGSIFHSFRREPKRGGRNLAVAAM